MSDPAEVGASLPAALTDAFRMPEPEKRRRVAMLEAKGVRPLPYPFASAMAAVSDLDGAFLNRYRAYVGSIVQQFGLDFGDSTWIRPGFFRRGEEVVPFGFGFFRENLALDSASRAALSAQTRTFAESLDEYHQGNIDHFHAFLEEGPRVMVIDRTPARDGRVLIRPGPIERENPFGCDGLFLLAITVVGRPGRDIRPRAITVRERNGTLHRDYAPKDFEGPDNGRTYRQFARRQGPHEPAAAPEIGDIEWITVDMADAEDAAAVEWVFLNTMLGSLLLDRLKFLRAAHNVEMALVTEHAGWHFRQAARAERSDGQLAERRGQRAKLEAWCGRMHDRDGRLMFSTDADEPGSFARVLPDIVDDLEVRFVMPRAAHDTRGFDVFELVTPSPTRSGGGIYFAKRILPNLSEPAGRAKFDGIRSRADTFAPRLLRALGDAAVEPGLFWPIYTHLGQFGLGREVVADDPPADEVLPSPYVDGAALSALQDSVFNITGKVTPETRVWFARASSLYDYALIARSVADHVDRPDPNTIDIGSWHDDAIGKVLPRAAAQLYGLTFYVADAEAAQVRLDGVPLETIVRNAPDETGRASVTIADSQIVKPIFDILDPLGTRPDPEPGGGAVWIWNPGERPFGRLTACLDGGGGVSAPLYGWEAAGAQHLAFDMRCEPRAYGGLLLETGDGALFYFGDPKALSLARSNVLGAYFIRPGMAGQWRRFVAPFHALSWSKDARPGGPLPSHPLKSVKLLCAGAEGSSVDFRTLAMLRPRATALDRSGGSGFSVSGRVANGLQGLTVHLEGESGATTALTDAHGFFCFSGVVRGVYRLWGGTGRDLQRLPRGERFEVVSNVAGLRLERPL